MIAFHPIHKTAPPKADLFEIALHPIHKNDRTPPQKQIALPKPDRTPKTRSQPNPQTIAFHPTYKRSHSTPSTKPIELNPTDKNDRLQLHLQMTDDHPANHTIALRDPRSHFQ